MKIRNFIMKHIIKYPTHTVLNYMWTFGSLLAFLLTSQILSGIFLACYYIPHNLHALNSIIFLIQEVNGGWLIYRIHVVGSSLLFFALYLHLLRGIYYKLYTWENRYNWWSGYILFLLFMATAFFGYILPWGQMSYWAATVIINMVSIIPLIGTWLTTFLWGGSVVNSCTLQRMFVLHFILPFVIVALALLHISIIHTSNTLLSTLSISYNYSYRFQNPRRLIKPTDLNFVDLYPYFFIKDSVIFLAAIAGMISFIVFNPEYLTNYINWVPANPKLTPAHIVPEWYFLPFYGIVKIIPSKTVGIISMAGSTLVPIILPFVTKQIKT